MITYKVVEDETNNLWLENTDNPNDGVMAHNDHFTAGETVTEEEIEVRTVNVIEDEVVGTYSGRMAFRLVCRTCGGEGMVATGAFVGEEIAEGMKQCPTCKGSGVMW
jgi:DnaJ-class molecular chaperone